MLATVSPKGQITIPQALREQLGLRPGMHLEVSLTKEGHLDLAPADGLSKADRALALLKATPQRGLSADEILAMTRGLGEE